MKSLITLLLLLSLGLSLQAQISGKVQDDQQSPLSLINIRLLTATDSSFVQGTQTDEAGRFTIPISTPGQYFLRFTAIGQADQYIGPLTITDSTKMMELGAISMSEQALELEGVEVVAKKMLLQQNKEGTVINVGSSVMTQGSSALQVLERSPGIFIDQRNNTIALNGQNGVSILLNGKRLQLTVAEVVSMLEGMSADNIEKIELLTSPSAKYEAAGAGGLINIVLKKNREVGTNGSLSVSGGFGEGPKTMNSLRLTHQNARSNLSASYSYTLDHSATGFHAIGSNVVPVLGGAFDFDFLNYSEQKLSSHNLNLGYEQNLSENTVLGGSLLWQKSQRRFGVLNLANYSFSRDSLLRARININGNNRWDNVISNLYLERTWGEKGKVKLDLDYLRFDSENPTLASSQFLNLKEEQVQPEGDFFTAANRGRSHTQIDIGVLKVDAEKEFASQLKWEGGIKASYSQTANNAQIEKKEQESWQLDARSTTSVDLIETIGAAYSSFHYPIGRSMELSLGARFEYWERQSPSSTVTFGRLFPSLFFSKQFSERSQFQFSYTQRITRPDYNDLASFLVYNGPLSVFTGNPLLKPTITQNARLAYQHNALNFSMTYKYDENPIVRYQVVENAEGDLVLVSPQNMAYQKNLSLQTDIPVDVTPWWSFNMGIVGSLREFQLTHTKEQVVKGYMTYNLYGNHNVELSKSLSLELSGWYNGSAYDGSRHYKGFGMLNAGLRKQLKNDQGSFQLTVTDVFKSMRIFSDFGNLTQEAFQSRAEVDYRPESARSRIVRLSYFRTFGNKKIKTDRDRMAGSDEERARIQSE